jgi:hypothetical protein
MKGILALRRNPFFSLKMARVADLWLFGRKMDNDIGSAENLLSNVR